MKSTHLTLALSLTLLPLTAVAEPAAFSYPTGAKVAQWRAEAEAQKTQRYARYACMALERPLPGGGTCCVAGGGDVIRTAQAWAERAPHAGIGVPCAVPVNRVTAALNTPASCNLPDDWYDDKYQAYWEPAALIPADKVLELWYAALERLFVPISWFCDASGDHFVIITGGAACFHYYGMYVYQWNEEKQAFARRGFYEYSSRLFCLIPTRTEFLSEGMRVCGLSLTDQGNTLEYRHFFRYEKQDGAVRFPDEELRHTFRKL